MSTLIHQATIVNEGEQYIGSILIEGNRIAAIIRGTDLQGLTADHVIDLGPEGGDGGGTLMATGTPEEIADCPASYTGQYLKKWLAASGGNRILSRGE